MTSENDTFALPVAIGKPCPICSKPALLEFRPFCSRRCADVDLNRWLSGVYTLQGEDRVEEGKEGEGSPDEGGEPSR